MRAEFINPFVSAAFMVFEKFGKTEPTRGSLDLISSPIHGNDVNIVIGITGAISGQVIFGMSQETALGIASMMLMGMPLAELDEVASSAIGELGNIITGNAATELGNDGFFCRITPPTLFIGKEILVSSPDILFLVVPINTNLGTVNINVAMRENGEAH